MKNLWIKSLLTSAVLAGLGLSSAAFAGPVDIQLNVRNPASVCSTRIPPSHSYGTAIDGLAEQSGCLCGLWRFATHFLSGFQLLLLLRQPLVVGSGLSWSVAPHSGSSARIAALESSRLAARPKRCWPLFPRPALAAFPSGRKAHARAAAAAATGTSRWSTVSTSPSSADATATAAHSASSPRTSRVQSPGRQTRTRSSR